MNKLIALFFLIWTTTACSEQEAVYPESLVQLHRNVINDILENPVEPQLVKSYLLGMNEEGAWPDIDYTSKERGGWPPAGHLSRTLEIARAYHTRDSEFYRKKQVSDKIHRALDYWLTHDLICPNWWYPEIGVPKILNPLMLLMEAELSAEQIEKGVTILNRSSIGMTGQNKVWQSGNVLLKSLLLRNDDTIRMAADAIKEELVTGTGEGVQPDWSYHQHGPQLQFGNYGLSYVTDMMKWIALLRGTQFGFDENKVEILHNYLVEGQQWVTWKQMYDISACGRQLFPGAQESKAAVLAKSLKKMEKINPEYAEAYRQANNWQNLSGNRHFWRSDFQVQRTPDYYFSVKMCSERVIGAESCNSENLQGYYMGDGAAFLYQTQQEYKDIFPYWDWKKIPGTTVHQNNETLPVLTASGYRLESRFVGGVSDGKNGVAVMDYNRNGLKARKSWFMLHDAIVCLGSGITSSEGYPVTTAINQSFCHGEIVTEPKTLKNGEKGYLWVLHDKAGYYFPEGSKAVLTDDPEKGFWNRVAARYPETLAEAKIFKLWLEHGANPQNEKYQYVLVPEASTEKMNQLKENFPFKIINGTKLQEVSAADGNFSAVVFYEAGKSDAFGGIEVNSPCVVMIRKEDSKVVLSVSEPGQVLKELRVTLTGRYKGQNAEVNKNSTQITVELPSGGEAGKSVTIPLQKS